MAKKLVGKRELEKINTDNVALVRAALNADHVTKKGICDATGLKMTVLNNLFSRNPDLYAEYKVIRRTITDIAADNIVAIVMDRSHPQNYNASKEIMKTFKGELDESLDAKSGDEIKIEGGSGGTPVSIVFSKKE